MTRQPKPPFPKQQQSMPCTTAEMKPVPDHGEDSYKGSGRLAGKKAVIMVWQPGGLSHLDSYDPKPDSGSEYRGPFNLISKRPSHGFGGIER